MSQPQAQQSSKPKSAPMPSRLVGVVFVNAVQFGGVNSSVSVGRNVGQILPARVEPDGSAVAVTTPGERIDGVLLRRFTPTPQQSFVPWANVQELQYGLPE